MENTKTKFRPILFSTPMVQAILDGRKTMTRRVVKPQPECIDFYEDRNVWFPEVSKCPYEVGDVLWVRETHRALVDCSTGKFAKWDYKADMPDEFHKQYPHKWKPSIFMPKEACRIFLKVKSIKVERLQDISEEDAIAEGCSKYGPFGEFKGSIHPNGGSMRFRAYSKASRAFQCIWETINGFDSWKKNPFVFVYEFERIEKPLDFT